MNDFEKFESELNELYTSYVLKFRILSYLEKELEGHFRNQREKVQVNILEFFLFNLLKIFFLLGSISSIFAINEFTINRTRSTKI
jgi:hypothetical protein